MATVAADRNNPTFHDNLGDSLFSSSSKKSAKSISLSLVDHKLKMLSKSWVIISCNSSSVYLFFYEVLQILSLSGTHPVVIFIMRTLTRIISTFEMNINRTVWVSVAIRGTNSRKPGFGTLKSKWYLKACKNILQRFLRSKIFLKEEHYQIKVI